MTRTKNLFTNKSIKNFVIVFILLPLIGYFIYGFSDTGSTYADCKQQICVQLPNGSPAAGHWVVVRTTLGLTIAQFTTDSTGCFPGPGLPNFTVGVDYIAYDETEDGCAASTQFTACQDGAVIITFCHN